MSFTWQPSGEEVTVIYGVKINATQKKASDVYLRKVISKDAGVI